MKTLHTIILLSATIVALPLAAHAQAPTALSNSARMAIDRQNRVMKARTFAKAADEAQDEQEETPSPYIPMLIQINNEDALQTLIDAGTIVYRRRDNIILACVPREATDKLTPDYGVCRAEISASINPDLNFARQATLVDIVQAGIPEVGIPALDGSGVIAGFTDTGFDAQHPAFDGRVAMLSDYDAPMGLHSSAYTPTEIGEWITDNTDTRHASHVCGIMAGGYKGNEMYGIATGATIAATTSRLTDVGILAGIEDIIDFSKEKQMPAVINMSLSSNIGPHDGSDLFCRYLDMCAEEAVIVMSSGNCGTRPTHYHHKFAGTADKHDQLYMAYTTYNDPGCFKFRGNIDIWAKDNKPFKVRMAIRDGAINNYIYTTEAITVDPEKPTSLIISGETDPEWGKYFTGYIGLYGEVNPDNNKSNVTLSLHHNTSEISPNGDWCRYYNVMLIEAEPGVEIDIFADYANVHLRQFLYVPAPDTNYSVSSIACGFNTLCVGASVTRNSFVDINEHVHQFGCTPGEIGSFTSYGQLFDGRSLPHFAAPGQVVLSAGSLPYALAHPEVAQNYSHVAEKDGKQYHWLHSSGTSMASPHVAGIAALMLQVNPQLTGPEIRQILAETANADVPDPTNPRWGAGLVNAFEAVKKVYSSTSSADITAASQLLVSRSGKNIELTMAADYAGATVSLYRMDGTLAAQTVASSSGASLQAPSKGIYILYVCPANANTITKKIVIN